MHRATLLVRLGRHLKVRCNRRGSHYHVVELLRPNCPVSRLLFLIAAPRSPGDVYQRLVIRLGLRRLPIVVSQQAAQLFATLNFTSTLDAKHLQRFKNEAYAAAQLHHTNIVPVFATGC